MPWDREKHRASSSRISKRWRQANPEKARAAKRRWYEANVERVVAVNSQWRERNPDKATALANAKQAVAKALRQGQLVRPEACEWCSATGVIEAAHEDYSRLLDVRWLCRSCHRTWDYQQPKLAKGS